MNTFFPATILAQEFHDIAPPVSYSLIPPWMIFAGVALALFLIGGAVWLIVRAIRNRAVPPQLPRDRALAALGRMQGEIGSTKPYEFSIKVSDILRSYVSEQFGLPITRQTSVEFLEALRQTPRFSETENMLLEDFLNRCDLIKFARYDATTADSELLLEEATRFVKGGSVVPALV